MLKDSFGREVNSVRMSLTDRCNFDCVYCHNEGLGDTRGPLDPQSDEISTEDVIRFLEVCEEFGINSVKFTGGEPMLRQDLEEIIRRTPQSFEISLTTNGTFLPGRAQALADAGLNRVNISLDALDRDSFAKLTKSGAFDIVLSGIDSALEAGLTPVKLNMVVFRQTAGFIPKMVDFISQREGLHLQLIEYMPELTGNSDWAIDISDVHEWFESRADRVEQRDMHSRKRYWFDKGMVEIVDPVGNSNFCSNCHRVRVTHDGYLKGCLNRNDDLKSMGDMTKQEIRNALVDTVSERVPFYGAYLIKNEDGHWIFNEKYQNSIGDRKPYLYS